MVKHRVFGAVVLAALAAAAGLPPTQAAPGRTDPALYLVGLVSGIQGVFRSDDAGQSWKRINDDQHQWGLILQVTGDPRLYGRVYVRHARARNRLRRPGHGATRPPELTSRFGQGASCRAA